jgi:hypothetical protein
MEIYTNYGNKDIIIDNEIRPIIHIVNKGHARINLPSHNSITLNNVLFEETKSKPIFMLAASKKLKGCTVNKHQITPSYIGTMIFSKAINEENLKFSSLEI